MRLPFKKTVVRERDEHSISRRDIDPDALKVLYRLNRSGHIAYLVGGGVRDLLLGRKPKDFDIGTSAHPGEIKKLFRNCFLIGRRFRLAHIKFGSKIIETSTFRRQPKPEKGGGDLLQRRDNTFGTPEEDARRRDFTINGLFYDIDTFNVIDYVGGLRDLEKKLVRCIGDPGIRFREDPVRMIRAVRFASRLGFKIEGRTWRAVRKYHAEIVKAPPSRLLEELARLFAYRSGAAAMRLLHESGMMADLLPVITDHIENAKHGGEAFWKYLAVLDRRGRPVDPPPMQAWMGVVLYPVFAQRAVEAAQAGKHTSHFEIARDVVREVVPSVPVPKHAFFRIVHMFDTQRRLEGPPPKSGDASSPPKRRSGSRSRRRRASFSPALLVAQKSFPDALRLREVVLEAEGEDKGYLREWNELIEKHAPKRAAEKRRPRSRRPRRHRSGRKRMAAEQPRDGMAR